MVCVDRVRACMADARSFHLNFILKLFRLFFSLLNVGFYSVGFFPISFGWIFWYFYNSFQIFEISSVTLLEKRF